MDGVSLNEAVKISPLMQELGAPEHLRHCTYFIPKHPRDFSCKETTAHLKATFGEKTPISNTRYNCIKVIRQAKEDIPTFPGRVNQDKEQFSLKIQKDDQFKSLRFVCSLTSAKYNVIRTSLFTSLDSLENLSSE